jgi:uncharacterized membrane protein YfcA
LDVTQSVELGVAAFCTAILGSMLGLGGGVFLVPIFTLFFGVDQKLAIGASAVAVATNSVVGSTVHLESRFTNLRFAMMMEVTTAFGALIGAIIGVWAPEKAINFIFASVLVYSAVSMAIKRASAPTESTADAPDPHTIAGEYLDPATKRIVRYVPQRLRLGLSISTFAGLMSGMLGVGGGVIKVPVMNVLMRIPVKAAAGTSTFMVGITAVASSSVYYSRGKIDPTIVIPAMIGIYLGSQFGSRLTRRLHAERLMLIFVLILAYLSISLFAKAFGYTLPGQQ